MKKFITTLFTLTTVLTSAFSFAQNEDSLLWEISGNGLEKPSYVFGTIHMICEEDYFMNDKIENALYDSDVLITEINFTNMEEMMLMQQAMQSEKPLNERISKDQFDRLQSLLKEKLDMDISMFENVSESGIASLITLKAFPCENIKVYEMELLQKAMLGQKQFNGLETVSEQMQVMQDHLNMDASIKLLEELGSTEDMTNEMVSLYKKQSIDKLLDLMKDSSYMDAQAYEDFVVTRNNNWVKKMPELMKASSTFFAVGAAHLGSNDGVLQLLRALGYKVEAVN